MTFDWITFGLQVINVLILLALLQKFLFAPIAGIIAARQSAVNETIAVADRAKKDAETEALAAKAEAEATAKARAQIIDQTHTEAEKLRAELLAQARKDADAILAEARDHARRDSDAHAQQAQNAARDLAISIAKRAIIAQPKTDQAYLERLLTTLRAMPDAQRETLLHGRDLRLRTAVAPAADLSGAFSEWGVQPRVEPAPDLIAGIELSSSNGTLHNSLAADLATITKALHDDGK